MDFNTPFTGQITHQKVAVLSELQLDSGYTLKKVPIAYTNHGKLNSRGDNAIVICHALTGSADVTDWWKQMFAFNNKALDPGKFFIICMNALGSPYGSASPVTPIHGEPKNGLYGPNFPTTTFADDVRAQKAVLDRLGVKQIAAVIGGSMGGMMVLEYAFLGKDYVRSIIPIATTAMQSAWAIGWGENQRHMIYNDTNFNNGYYTLDAPPSAGLGAARMSAMLTYRSIRSFSSRFGRNVMKENKIEVKRTVADIGSTVDEADKSEVLDRVDSAHSLTDIRGIGLTETHRHAEFSTPSNNESNQQHSARQRIEQFTVAQKEKPFYAMQSYLRYQAEKFKSRFDANCYIALTEKMDSHDISRYSLLDDPYATEQDHLSSALGRIIQPALILGIESDGLYTFEESLAIARGIPNSAFARIDSEEGHDAFLIHSDQVDQYLRAFFLDTLPEFMT